MIMIFQKFTPFPFYFFLLLSQTYKMGILILFLITNLSVFVETNRGVLRMSEKGYRTEKRALRDKSAGKASSSLTMATVLPENTSVVVGLPVEAGTLPRVEHEGTSEEGAQLVRNNKRKISDLSSKSQTEKKSKHQWDFNFASDYSITESPKAVASLLRHFRRPGFKIPMFNQFSEVNRENYFRFAGCIGQLLAEYNRAVDSYEDQLRTSPPNAELKEAKDMNNELTAQLKKKMQIIVEEKVKVADRVQGSVLRIKRLESKVKEIELERDDLKKKFQLSEDMVAKLEKKDKANSGLLKESEARCEALIRIRSKDVSTKVCEMRKELTSKYEEILQKVKSHLEQKDVFQKSLIRAAETNANFELLNEIVKGIILDPQAELEDVSRDKDEATKELAKMTVPEFDFKLLELSQISDSAIMPLLPPERQTNSQRFDEFGSNMDLRGALLIDENQETV